MSDKYMLIVAAIVSTLAEAEGSPESNLYLLCGMDMEKWQLIRQLLLHAHLINIRANYVTLTAQGMAFGAKINAALKANQVAK
jgi:predicted transcriptional regulator